MRNAGGNVAIWYGVSDLLPSRKCIGGLHVLQICQVTARIPHQSKIGSEEPIFASFSPGEAIGAVRLTNSPINRNLWIKRVRSVEQTLFVIYFWSQLPQPQPQLPEEQAQLSGQPMHFLPLFLDLQMNHPEKPRIKRTTAIMI